MSWRKSAISSRSRERTRSRFGAYRNAAETASHLAERLADLTPPQRLAIPGIGKDLAAKIGTLIETGSIPYHQELLQEFPASILDLLHLQGVGPKTAALLYRELGIRTLDDLEAAITQGRLRGVKGIGEKKAGQILRAIGERAQVAGRRLMAEATETAEPLLAALRAHAPDGDISLVGSLRRGCETTGDLDIVAGGAPPSVIDAFTGYDQVERVLAHGATRSRACCCAAASRRISGWCARESLGAGAASTSPGRRPTTSRCATARSSAASS